MELQDIRDVAARLKAEVHKVVVGQDAALDLMLVALLSDGHVLLEGVPGTAKTLLARAFAATLGVGFNRIQFTPDLMPGDVLGTNLFNFQTNGFVLTKGPIFTDVLLADEINRTPPKTQAALLQAMQERAVTIDGTTHPLPACFMVLATQNPIEQEGTYPLPEAQLDRFLFKIAVGYPARDEERQMVRLHGHRTATPPIAEFGLSAVAGPAELAAMRRAVAAIRLEDPVGRLRRGPRAGHPRPAGPPLRGLAARRQHARHRGPGPGGGAGAGLRHPRRRQGAGPAGAAPPGGAGAGGGDRGAHHRRGGGEGRRGGRGPPVIAPTRRAILLAAAGLPLALLPALVAPSLWGAWLVAGALSALAFGLDLLLSVAPGRLAIEVEVPGTLQVGEAGAVAVRLLAPRPVARVEVLLDLHPDFEPAAPVAISIPPGEAGLARLPLRARRRGRPTVDAAWCRWTGPFGLVARRSLTPLGRAVAVVPDLAPVRAAAFRYQGARSPAGGVQVERFVGAGSEFDALVEWVPGLDHRAISWKASARHRKLLSQDFRAERDHQVVLALDTGHLMAGPLLGRPRLDHALTSALLLGYVSLRMGDRVGLFAFDRAARAWTEPQGGLGAFARLRAASAALEATTDETNFTLGLAELSTRLRRRSLVVVFTDFVDSVTAELMVENLGRLARRQLVVFVTLRDEALDATALGRPGRLGDLHRAVVASGFLRERAAVLARLRRLGVLCVEAGPGEVSTRLVSRYLDVKRRELIA